MPNKLMFEVGVIEVDKKISALRQEFDDFEAKYGQNGIKVNLDLKGAIGDVQALVDALKLVGDVSKLKQYEEEIAKLKKKLDDLQSKANGTGSSTATGVDQTTKSVNTATDKIQYLMNILKDVQNMSVKFGGANFDTTRLDNSFDKLVRIRQELELIKSNGGLHPVTGQTANQIMSEANISGIERNLKMELSYYKQIETEFERIEKLKAGLQNVLGGITDPAKQQEIRRTIRNLQNMQSLVTHMGTNDARFFFGGNEYKNRMANANILLKESVGNIKAYQKTQQKAATDEQKSVNQAAIQWEKLGVKIRDLQALRDKGMKLGLDPTEINNYIRKIAELRYVLQKMMNGENNGRSQAFFGLKSDVYTNQFMSHADTKKIFIRGEEAVGRYASGVKGAAGSVRDLASEEQKLAQALSHSSNAMKNQSMILSDLKMMAYQYLSIWGAQNFLSNIIEVGGQLEKQRLSIGAILGDVSHANDLFGKIKDLAVKSPFGVVELDQFTKQLSAYGFKYNELYDMTKRLADIAAGAGTDVSRLTLAIGHVRAEGALTGYTLRQFAMNNIPMVSELAKKLSEVEGRIVTVADVRKRVSKKEIGYEDVIDVIKNLTNEGGMFYNMQETISQSIQARFKNLRDSLDIMYGEIAESGIGDALKELAIILTDMSRNWKSFIPIIQSAIIGWGAYKAATLAVSMAMGKNTVAVTSNILAYKKKRAEELMQDAMVRKLTADEELLIRTRTKLTAANIRAAMSTGAMTKEEALRLVALRKLTIEEAAAAVNMGLFTEAEVMAARSSSLLITRIKLLGTAIKTSLLGLASTVFTPLNTAFAGLMIGMSARQRMNDFDEQREQRRNTINERANEGYKNLLEVTKNFQVGKSLEMTKTDINLSLDEMMDKLKEYSMFYNTTFNEAFKVDEQGYAVHSLAEQYEILAKAIEDAANANKLFAEMRDLVSHALETSDPSNGFLKNVGHVMYDWLLGDNVKANLGSLQDSLAHYAESVREAGLAENLLMRDHLSLRRALDGRGLGDVMNMSNEELMNTLSRVRSTMPEVFAAVRKSLSAESRAMVDDWTQKCNEMNEAYGVANLKMRKAGNDLYESLKTKYGDDMTKWPSEWREFVFMAMDAATKDVKGFSDMSIEYQNLVRDSFLKPFKISVDSDEAKEKVNNLLVDLQNLVGKTWTIKIGVKGESAWADLETSGKKFQEADKKVKQLEKNLKRLNYNFVPGYTGNSLEAEKVADEYNDAIAERRAARIIYESYGGDVSDLQKEKTKKPRSGSGEDKEAKRLREIVKLYKDAYDWYVKYEKQVGESRALIKVQEQFQPLFDEFNKQWNTDLSLDSIPTYKKNIEELLDEAMKIYQQPAHKNNYMVDAIKVIRDAISNVDFEELGRNQDEWASSLTRNLEELTRKWEIYNSVVSGTGDRALASRLSGISPGVTPADLKRASIASFAGARIDFDSVLGMSGEEIDQYVENIGVAEKKIKAVQNGLKEWKKAQEDLTKSDIQNYTKWLGSLVDLESIRMRNQEEYNRILEETNRLLAQGIITEEEAANRRSAAASDKDSKNWQATSMYSSLYNNSLAMAEGEFFSAYNQEMANLYDQMKQGKITIQDYADKVEKLNRIAAEFENQGFLGIKGGAGAYLSGGYQGLIDYHWNKAKEKRANNDEEGAKEEEDTAKAMEKAMKAAEQLAQVFNDLSNGANLLSNLFDSLGMEGAANAFGDAAGVLGGVTSGAQSLSAFGPWGMAVGGAIGGLTSIFALSDKNHERRIQELKEEVSKIDNTLNTIRSLRERELGYDSGNLRRQMASMYRTAYFSSSNNEPNSAIRGMREYYGRYSGGNGYSQEYNALTATRKKYMEMYDEEYSKKKSSNEALEEYKTKIAELDEQIMFFTEDLANELWGIDIQGWADQVADSIWTAFENGEDAVEAFGDTARDIVSSVAKEMWQLSVLEPRFKELREALFGTNGAIRYDSNGNIDMQASEQPVMEVLGKYLGPNGIFQQDIAAGEEFYNWVQKISGIDLSKESSSNASASIKNITEETADLLASYVNSIRAYCAMDNKMIADYFPQYLAAMTQGNASLANIENHTAAIMRSNDIIASKITNLDNNINGLKSKTWQVPIA